MMSAALKQKPPVTPTPFPSPERAALAHAIAALADASTRRAAIEQASQTANAAVLRAIEAAEAAETALAEAGGNAVRHLVDKARGTAGAAPMTVREARAKAIEAQDHLDEARAVRAQLKAELDKADNGLPSVLVADAARAVIRSEMQQRAIALAAEVAGLQQQLVAKGSALQWLHGAGVFPRVERGKDDPIGHTVGRMESAPQQWATGGTVRYSTAFAEPTGGNAWATAFEALQRDPNAPLPD